MQYSVFVCGNSIANVQRMKTFTLKPEVINQQCMSTFESKEIKIMWHVSTNNVASVDMSVKVDFVVQ